MLLKMLFNEFIFSGNKAIRKGRTLWVCQEWTNLDEFINIDVPTNIMSCTLNRRGLSYL